MPDKIADTRGLTRRKIIIVLQPEVAISPDLLRTDQWPEAPPFDVLRALHPALKPRRYFTSIDEWAVPHPSAPPTPLPGSERGARYFYFEPGPGADAEMLLNFLRDQSVVDTAYEERPADEPPTTMEPENDPLSAYQVYLGPPPKGINAVHAWELGVTGHGASFIDVEQGWFLDHEDLIAHHIGQPLSGVSREFEDHGTSVLGQLIASDNQSGVIGIAPQATGRVVSEWRDSITRKTADALLFAVSQMTAGEVLLIQAQTRASSADGVLMPVEVEDANFEVIAFAALERGVVVIEPAGNGGQDLDQFEHSKHGSFLNRSSPAYRDSGAIMVAAATLGSTSRVADSSYGSRIDCFALGERITTAEGKNDYTHVFSQTSGASAIIAGAALLLQSWRSLQGREPLNALEMRNLLGADVNTLSGGDDRIGVMPNLGILITP